MPDVSLDCSDGDTVPSSECIVVETDDTVAVTSLVDVMTKWLVVVFELTLGD